MDSPERRRFAHHTELGDEEIDGGDDGEWKCYCREVARLLAEGNEGRWVLIKEDAIVGIWDTEEEVMKEAYRRYLLGPCLVHKIRTWEPVLIQKISYF